MRNWIIFTKRSHNKKAYDLTNLEHEVKSLSRLFEGSSHNVFLIGGVGLALRNGGFSRDHKDFDIAIFTKDLSEITRLLSAQGYMLVRRKFFTHLFSFLDMQIVASFDPDQMQNFTKDRLRLRFLRRSPAIRMISSRIEMIDIFLWDKKEEGVFSYAYNLLMPWDDVRPLHKINVNSGLVIPSLQNWKYFKPKSRVQKKDFERMCISKVKIEDK